MRRNGTRFLVVLLWGVVSLEVAGLTPMGLFLERGFAANKKREKSKKQPNPGKTLRQVYKNLGKAQNYSVSLSVVGGLSDNKEHKVTESNVNVSYDATVFRGNFMHVPLLKAYRTPKKGVAKFDGVWKNVLSAPEGKKLERFFRFPHECLERAMRHSKRAVWVKKRPAELTAYGDLAPLELGEEGDEDAPEGDAGGKTGPPGKGGPGKTGVAKKAQADDKNDAAKWFTSRVIRVEVPTKQALQHFIEVENSGCFSGG